MWKSLKRNSKLHQKLSSVVSRDNILSLIRFLKKKTVIKEIDKKQIFEFLKIKKKNGF